MVINQFLIQSALVSFGSIDSIIGYQNTIVVHKLQPTDSLKFTETGKESTATFSHLAVYIIIRSLSRLLLPAFALQEQSNDWNPKIKAMSFREKKKKIYYRLNNKLINTVCCTIKFEATIEGRTSKRVKHKTFSYALSVMLIPREKKKKKA